MKVLEEQHPAQIVYRFTCPKCGEDSDTYTESMVGEEIECICGEELEIVEK